MAGGSYDGGSTYLDGEWATTWASLPPFDVGQVAVNIVAAIVACLTFVWPQGLDRVALIACGAVAGGLSQVSVQVTAGKITYSEVQPCLGQVERTLRACHYRGPRPGLGGSHKQCSAGVVSRILLNLLPITLYTGLERRRWCAALRLVSSFLQAHRPDM